MSSIVDLRKFKYQLAPVLKVAGWRLDSLNAVLGKSRRAYDQCASELNSLESDFEVFSHQLKSTLSQNFELIAHRNGILFLQQQKEKIEKKKRDLSEKRSVLDKALAECVKHQQKIELLDNHRQECLEKFVLEETNVLSSEADREWNAKLIFKKIEGQAKR